MKVGIIISSAIFVVGVLFMLIQLWFAVWEPQTFIKIMITAIAFFVVSLLVSFVTKEIAETNKLKNHNDL
jgi:hypothetical protein